MGWEQLVMLHCSSRVGKDSVLTWYFRRNNTTAVWPISDETNGNVFQSEIPLGISVVNSTAIVTNLAGSGIMINSTIIVNIASNEDRPSRLVLACVSHNMSRFDTLDQHDSHTAMVAFVQKESGHLEEFTGDVEQYLDKPKAFRSTTLPSARTTGIPPTETAKTRRYLRFLSGGMLVVGLVMLSAFLVLGVCASVRGDTAHTDDLHSEQPEAGAASEANGSDDDGDDGSDISGSFRSVEGVTMTSIAESRKTSITTGLGSTKTGWSEWTAAASTTSTSR
ncbi:hypothetical protein ElyMa_005981100 [Elysia marginata]|uniref:Uncharacterized protein n=1 Tax=Elysia marginata TaxID=1093978 RepID=A0AAV4GF02_9GAST|nr:hypothetical protein ElyMa_005981100 [Elysia marginata]